MRGVAIIRGIEILTLFLKIFLRVLNLLSIV